jgi:hypothetical protein
VKGACIHTKTSSNISYDLKAREKKCTGPFFFVEFSLRDVLVEFMHMFLDRFVRTEWILTFLVTKTIHVARSVTWFCQIYCDLMGGGRLWCWSKWVAVVWEEECVSYMMGCVVELMSCFSLSCIGRDVPLRQSMRISCSVKSDGSNGDPAYVLKASQSKFLFDCTRQWMRCINYSSSVRCIRISYGYLKSKTPRSSPPKYVVNTCSPYYIP